MKQLIKRNPLYFAFFLPALADGLITLLGQGESYWSQTRIVNEVSPAYYFLLASPWLFAIGSLVWFVFWYWLFRRLKEPLNLFLTFLFISGHSWGSTSWIWNIMKRNGVYVTANQLSVMFVWLIVVLYFALIAINATYFLRIYIRDKYVR